METFSPHIPEQKFKTPEEELAYLRGQIAVREKAIAEKGENTNHETLARQAVSSYAEKNSTEVLHKDFVIPKERSEAIVLDLAPEEHDSKISELLGIMQTHGIKNVLSIIEKMNDPHVQDDFERFLVQYLKAGFPLQGMNEKSPEFKALHMTLYEVTLPEKTDEEKQKALKEVISSMEQFYSGMMSVDDPIGTGYFTIELAVANHSEEFSFNVAVHDAKKSLFLKQMLSIFHNAKIVEKKDDYNIFNEKGITVASYAHYAKNSIWPLKTYDQFDHDPLNSILNSFSKIKLHGEGAAIQIVVKPQGDVHTKRYKKIFDDIMKGEKISEAIAKNDEGIVKNVEGFF
ncbi:MAG: hypothetical protein NT077_03095, partial [Candidatus Taylorbacteria bacterium]|nr:hypothetical protein [Candidatus Taylorbacteria bacterium]